MKHCFEKISLLTVTILTVAVFTTFLIAQTHEAQNPSSYQSTSLAGQEHTTNPISRSHESRKMMTGLGQTVKNLKSKRVESKNGDKLGSISDLIIDTQSGRVAYVVIASRGIAGMGKQEKAVPPSSVSTATTKRDVVSLNATQDRWNRAPGFNKDQMATLSDPAYSRKLNQYYQEQNTTVAQQSPQKTPLSPTGRTEGQMQLASQLIGKKVVNAQDQDIGKISDVLVDIDQPEKKPAFAILKPGSWVIEANRENRGKMFVIPVKLLRPSNDKNKLTLNINAEQFRQPQPMTSENWSAAGAGTAPTVVYSYQSKEFHPSRAEPDNTRLNQRERQPSAVTSEDQSETKEDLHLTQDIRRTLVKQDDLSTSRKDVTIVSSNGLVILRGPVASPQEKEHIGVLAEQVAGAGKVQNQLEVMNKK